MCGRKISSTEMASFIVKGVCKKIPSTRLYTNPHKVDGYKIFTERIRAPTDLKEFGTIEFSIQKGRLNRDFYMWLDEGKRSYLNIESSWNMHTFSPSENPPEKYSNVIKFAIHMFNSRCKR